MKSNTNDKKIFNVDDVVITFNENSSKDSSSIEVIIENNRTHPIYNWNIKFAYSGSMFNLWNADLIFDDSYDESIDKINSNLDSDEYIKDYKIMRKNIYDNYVELEIFFTVVENITDYKKIVD